MKMKISNSCSYNNISLSQSYIIWVFTAGRLKMYTSAVYCITKQTDAVSLHAVWEKE